MTNPPQPAKNEQIDLPRRLHFGIPTVDELIGPSPTEKAPKDEGSQRFDSLASDQRTTAEGQRFWRFGISLPRRPRRDEAFEILRWPKGEEVLAEGPIASSVNIIGGDGSGKSILALHMASAYAADLVLGGQRYAKVIYASSDLSYERAESTWKSFGLDRPLDRQVPFEGPGWSGAHPIHPQGVDPESKEPPICHARRGAENVLRWLDTPWTKELQKVEVKIEEVQARSPEFHKAMLDSWQLPSGELRPVVHFLDLSSTTAGDDWGLLNRVLGGLEPLNDERNVDGRLQADWPHMLVIDAVEGLEAIVGEIDAYGLESSRRSRIAHLMQMAAGKCHVVLVNELRKENERLDEEFVTDLVIRLRMRERESYTHRTIEVVKARSQSILRGEHVLTIRGGKPWSSHAEVWPDMPRVGNAYMHCFQSIDARDRRLTGVVKKGPTPAAGAKPELPGQCFGVTYLDNLLGPRGSEGVRRGRLTTIVGDEGTHKVKLVRSFVANAFTEGPTRMIDRASKNWDFVIYFTASGITKEELRGRLESHWEWKRNPQYLHGDDSLLHWKRTDPEAQPDRVATYDELANSIHSHILLRNLEISTTTANVFAHIFEELVDTAKHVWKTWQQSGHKPKDVAPSIRFVIDDFALMRKIHPVLERDERLLPYLLRYLQQEGVTVLIADTHPGQPYASGAASGAHVLRGVADRVIYTWPVPFFNENRVAITVGTPVDEYSESPIRELRIEAKRGGSNRLERVEVDPHFEMYAGIEQAKPELVPLQIMLRSHSSATAEYVKDIERSLSLNFLKPPGKPSILQFSADEYDELKAMASGRASFRLDQTTVLQIDEFWAHKDSKGLYDLRAYLQERTGDGLADPANSFEARRDSLSGRYQFRYQFFDHRRGSGASYPPSKRKFWRLKNEQEPEPERQARLDRSDRLKIVPYYWDLGFLLLNRHLWTSAPDQFAKIQERLDAGERGEGMPEASYKQTYVQDVWACLSRTRHERENAAQRRHAEDEARYLVREKERATLTELIKTLSESDCAAEAGVVSTLAQRLQTLASESAPCPPSEGSFGSCSWRKFLRACQFVANSAVSGEDHETLAPFDLEMTSPESFACLVLEMWLSEIAVTQSEKGDLVRAHDRLREPLRQKGGADSVRSLNVARCLSDRRIPNKDLPTLTLLLENFSFELYLVWCLLIEVMDAAHFKGSDRAFSFVNRPPRENAVAIRHWYSSSVEFMRNRRGDEFQVARLPGYFTTRGDWFLAIARSSRSRRLGQKAIDQLTSRRANLTRLQQGVGLPVRRIMDEATSRNPEEREVSVRTALPAQSENGNELLRFKRFEALTCPIREKKRDEKEFGPFFGWLWRSNIVGYHHDSRIFGGWLFGTLSWTSQIKQKRAADWRNGFRNYDLLRLFYEPCREAFLGDEARKLEDLDSEKASARIRRHREDLTDPELHRRDPELRAFVDLEKSNEAAAALTGLGGDGKFAEFRKSVAEEFLELDSFREFKERCDFLINQLKYARPPED